MPSHYLNQCWLIVYWTLRNNLQWNSNKKTKVFIHENASECVVTAILSRKRWVNNSHNSYYTTHILHYSLNGCNAIYMLWNISQCPRQIRKSATFLLFHCWWVSLFMKILPHGDICIQWCSYLLPDEAVDGGLWAIESHWAAYNTSVHPSIIAHGSTRIYQ